MKLFIQLALVALGAFSSIAFADRTVEGGDVESAAKTKVSYGRNVFNTDVCLLQETDAQKCQQKAMLSQEAFEAEAKAIGLIKKKAEAKGSKTAMVNKNPSPELKCAEIKCMPLLSQPGISASDDYHDCVNRCFGYMK